MLPQEDYDTPYFDDDWLMSSHATPVLHVQGACRPPEIRARLFLKTRLHMVMKLRGCSFAEAYRIIKEKDAARGEKENG